jgi:chemotaxis protein MotB
MHHKHFAALLICIAFTSCVPQRKYLDLKKDYDDIHKKNNDCGKLNSELHDSAEKNHQTMRLQGEAIKELNQDTALLGTSNRKLNMLYKQVNDTYEKLLSKVKELEAQNNLHSHELSTELLDAQKKLQEREKDLEVRTNAMKQKDADMQGLNSKLTAMQSDLLSRQKRVQELEHVLNQKDSVVKALKSSISDALISFKDQGLSVNIKNGKVYVSMEEKLLFPSGKYIINANGKEALMKLAQVLNQKADVNIMVEGHTDNVPYKSNGSAIKDNLDLSVLRATEVSRILATDGKVVAGRIIAAGRGDTQPVMDNATADGRAKNRRTEIILTPKLSELFKILGE